MVDEPRRSLDEYGPGEMAIPEWRLLQKVGGDWAKALGGKEGQFFNKITDELADELNIVVVDILMGRAKWGTEISDAGPVCASMDAKNNLSIYGDDCLQCPDRADAPWALDAAERRAKCCLNYSILGIDLDHDLMPIMLRAHGTSALAMRQLITQLKMNRALRGEYYRALVNIKCQEKNTPFGTTYVIHPKIVQLIEDASKVEELRIESNRLLGAPIALPEARPEEEAGHEPLGYTPTGTPFYSEEERARLMAQIPAPAEAPPTTTVPAEVQLAATEASTGSRPVTTPPAAAEASVAAAPPVTPTPAPAPSTAVKEPEPGKEPKETTEKKPLDLDF